MKLDPKKFVPRSCRDGFAIITVVAVMVVLSVFGAVSVSLIGSGSRGVEDEYSSELAFSIAQAGLEYVAAQLKGDGNWSNNAGFSKSFGGGSFTVTYTALTASSATAKVDGIVNGITRSITQNFSMSGGGFASLSYAIYTEGDISTGGSSSGSVTGDIAARGTITNDGAIVFDGEVSQDDEDVDVPTPNWAYWQGAANTTIFGNYTFNSGTYNGIYYVNGNVGFQNNVIINGTLVATGTITAAGNEHVTISSPPPNPALIAGNTITFTGTTDMAVTGWIYSGSQVRMLGNTDVVVNGGIGAVGNVEFSGNSDDVIVYMDEVHEHPPSGFDGGEMSDFQVAMGTWQEVY